MQILSVPVIILLLLWKSEGVTIADLNRDDVNYRNTLYGFIGIGALSCIYSVGVATVGLAGMKLPALLVHSLGFFTVFLLLTMPEVAVEVLVSHIEDLGSRAHISCTFNIIIQSSSHSCFPRNTVEPPIP